MNCREFLERHSEYRDGLISAPRERRRFERHLAQCAGCRRYDATVTDGVSALRDVAHIEPSPEFRPRLDARLRREQLRLAPPPMRTPAGLATALWIAAALALLLVEGTRPAHRPVASALPPVPFPKPVAQPSTPFVTFQDPRASVVTGNPNPYGTALVQPASARTPASGR